MRVMEYTTPRHPIGYVAASTGLSTHVVRVWERRYGAVKPLRTGTNRRLYSDADIDRLKLLRALTESGHAIGGVAQRDDSELREILRNLSVPGPSALGPAVQTPAKAGETTSVMRLCQQAVIDMDVRQLNVLLLDSMVNMSQIALLEDVIAPLMEWVGDRWHDGSLRIAQEHLATAAVKSFLIRLRQSTDVPAHAPLVAISTPPGESHELGALMAALAATTEGWNPLYFGPSLPAAEMANAASRAEARAVALSVAIPREAAQWLQEVRDLRQFLPGAIMLILGGSGIAGIRAQLEGPGIRCVDDLRGFQAVLRELRQ